MATKEKGLDNMAEIAKEFILKHILPQKGVKTPNAPSEKSDSEKNFKYGMLYEKGKVVPRNLNTALDYFLKAAAKGNIEAKAHAGAIYVGAMNSPTSFSTAVYDKEKGLALLFETANLGNITAKKFLMKLNYTAPTD